MSSQDNVCAHLEALSGPQLSRLASILTADICIQSMGAFACKTTLKFKFIHRNSGTLPAVMTKPGTFCFALRELIEQHGIEVC